MRFGNRNFENSGTERESMAISKKEKAIRLGVSLIASNLGIALLSYSGFRLGWWSDQTLWKMLFSDGCYFCVGAFVNTIYALVEG
jgi:hypothetical protein